MRSIDLTHSKTRSRIISTTAISRRSRRNTNQTNGSSRQLVHGCFNSTSTHLHFREEVHPSPSDQLPMPVRQSSAGMRHGVSPYLQKLPHSNFIQVIPSGEDERKKRRITRRRSTSTVRPRCHMLEEAYQMAVVDHLDLSTFSVRKRPTSAPLRQFVFTEDDVRHAHVFSHLLVECLY